MICGLGGERRALDASLEVLATKALRSGSPDQIAEDAQQQEVKATLRVKV
ncbi:hypothetical protein [Rhizobium phaseoli]|nr:hypothetical protein [Rhizobium phaseoli]